MSESVLRIVIDSRNAEQNARNLSRELNSIEKNGDFATKSMDSMSVATRNLAGYMASIVTVGAAINRMDTYTGINNKLKLVTSSQTELNQAMEDTFAIAQRSAASWTAVNDVYSKYLSNAKTLNLSQEETARLTEITSKAVSISGSSAESAASALFQYGQALDGGVLQAEEFNSLVDGAGGLLNAMAKGLSITRGELRQMMLDGELTGEVITKALLEAGDSVEELYSKTDFTIAQEFTRLSNEVTKFVGEAGKGSGAANVLGGSIRLLADNLEAISSIAMLGGVAYLTKTIIAQTVATQGAITASVTKRVALQAEISAQTQTLALEVQRTRQVTALALTELNLARQELNSATTRQARTAATMRLTQAEVALAIAQKQTTVATAAQTVAENALNTSRTRGAMLLGMVGGPIGAITLGVTALAAGYMYLSSRTAEANAKLEEQGKVANIATEELLKLEGAQKGQAKTDLAESFDAENKKLKLLNTEIGNYIAKLSSKNTADAETAEILLKVRTGTMTYDEAIKKLNKSHADQPDIITKMEDAIVKYKESAVVAQNNADKQKAMGTEVKLAGNAAQNAAPQIRNKANAMDGDASSTRNAAAANREYAAALNNSIFSNKLAIQLKQSKQFTDTEIKYLSQIADEKYKAGEKSNFFDAESIKLAKEAAKYDDSRIKAFEETTKSSARASKELASQQKEDAKEVEKSLKDRNELLRESKQLLYDYGTEFQRIESDLTQEISTINDSALKKSDKSNMIAEAKAISEARKQVYLLEYEQDLDSWSWSEGKKLTKSIDIGKARITATKGMSDSERETRSKALDELQAHELALIELAKEDRIFQMQQGLMHANASSEKYWSLERERISLNVLDLTERNRQLAIANELQAEEKRTNLNSAAQQWGQTQADMTGTGEQYQLEQERFGRLDESQELFDAQLALTETAAEREAIWQAHHDRMTMIESDYFDRKNQIEVSSHLSSASQLGGALAGMLDKSGGAYAVALGMQKSFSVYSSLMAAKTAYAQAFADPSAMTVPQKILGAMAVAAPIASALGELISIQTDVKGYATGGLVTGPGTGTSDSILAKLSDKEFVINAKATKRVGVDTLNAINSGKSVGGDVVVEPKIIINTLPGTTANVSRGADGSLTIDMVRKDMVSQINDQNSSVSKALKSSHGTRAVR